jgi:NDP-sugar pyrophosphorylase family protein
MAASGPNGSGRNGTNGSRNGRGHVERDAAIGAGYIPPGFATGNGHPSARALILAGGRGTRLAPYTSVLPKPLMPIGDRSILEIVIGQLALCGILDITLCVGHLSHLIEAVIGDGEAHGVAIDYVREERALGTAGPLRLAEGLDDTFIVMNGDVLSTLDYGELLQHHRESGSILTIATRRRPIKIDYGVLHVRPNGRSSQVYGYDEKPEVTSTVSMGIYVLEPEALAFIPPEGQFDFPDLVQAMLDARAPVHAYHFDGIWFDIGRHDDYMQAVEAWTESSLLAASNGGDEISDIEDVLSQ